MAEMPAEMRAIKTGMSAAFDRLCPLELHLNALRIEVSQISRFLPNFPLRPLNALCRAHPKKPARRPANYASVKIRPSRALLDERIFLKANLESQLEPKLQGPGNLIRSNGSEVPQRAGIRSATLIVRSPSGVPTPILGVVE
jgi:hypothetical protein